MRESNRSNNFAISSKGIGEALTRSASALAAAGNDVNQAIALITAGNTVVQDPTTVGTALKTMSMRLRKTKTELEAEGEDTDGTAEAISTYRQKLKALSGVDIMVNDDTYKSTYNVLVEMSAAWKDMTDAQRAASLEMMGGQRQANILAAIISNMSDAEKVYETSLNSSGSAMKENEAYMSSITGKVEQFGAAFEALSATTINSGFVKGIVDGSRSGVEALTWLIDKFGILSTIISGAGIFSFGKGFINQVQQLQTYTASLQSMAGASADINGLSAALSNLSKSQQGAVLSGLNLTNIQKQQVQENLANIASGKMLTAETFTQSAVVKNLTATQQAHIATEIQAIATKKGLTSSTVILTQEQAEEILMGAAVQKEQAAQIVTTVAQTQANKASAVSFKMVGASAKAAFVAMATNPMTWIMAAVAAISLLVQRLQKLESATQDAADAVISAQNALDSTKSEISNINTQLEELRTKIHEIQGIKSRTPEETQLLEVYKQQTSELTAQEKLLKEKEAREQRKKDEADAKLIKSANTITWGKQYKVDYTDGGIPEKVSLITKILQAIQTSGASSQDPVARSLGMISEYEAAQLAVPQMRKYKGQMGVYENKLLNGGTLTEEDQKKYDSTKNYYDSLVDIADSFLSIVDGSNIPEYKALAQAFYDAQNYSTYGLDDKSELQAERFGSPQSEAALESYSSANDFSKIVSEATKNVDILRNALDAIADDTFNAFSSDQISELLKSYPNLTDEIQAYADGVKTSAELSNDFNDALNAQILEDMKDAAEDVQSAYNDWGKDSYQVEQALQNMDKVLPGCTDGLYDAEGALNADALAAALASDDIYGFVEMMLAADVQSASLNFANAEAAFNGVSQAAINAGLAVDAYNKVIAGAAGDQESAKKALTEAQERLNNWKSGGGGGSRKSGGGGSSKKDDVLAEYEAAKKILESKIKISESTQEMLEESSDSYKAESQKQIDIYKEMAVLIQNNLDKLRAKGYDESTEEYMKLAEDLASINATIYNAQKALWEQARDAQVDAINSRKKALEKAHEEEMKQYDAQISRQEAIIALYEQQYSLVNDIRAERAELTKELEKAQAYTGLSQSEKESLFSDDDYSKLTSQLDSIESESVAMFNQYREQIMAVSVDEAYRLDYITSQFEQQYALKQKQYEIAKQELAVARARINLDNVQKNRNVAMLQNGQWTWLADPEAVQAALDDMYAAEEEKANAQSDYIQGEKIAELEEYKNSIKLQRDAAEAQHEQIMERLEEQLEALSEQLFQMNEGIANMEQYNGGVQSAFLALAAAVASGVSAIGSAASEAASMASSMYAQYGQGSANKQGSYSVPNALSRGAKGDAVSNLQSILSNSGYSVGKTGVDGIFGSKTESAVKSFQKDMGLSATGKVDSSTLNALSKLAGYSQGGIADYTGLAMLHGSKSNPETIFNSVDTDKLYGLVHSASYVTDLISKMVGNAKQLTSFVTQGNQASQNGQTFIINGITFGSEHAGMTLKDLASYLGNTTQLVKV